ncbi:hypothetical protein [Shewanella donghaensis]|uniref:hypothetical protein n=1 Tax=Shewanella donghaensis TaxID=238836 RepID=UPI001182C81E|nr:hypothetical protein [Shewanella donghaensis]
MKKTNISLSVAIAMCLLTSSPAFSEDSPFGGSLRANYSYKDYSEASKEKLGDFEFNLFALQINHKWDDYGVAMDYRFNNGYQALRYGYAFWDVNEDLTFNAGAIRKPFGNINFSSHSWWYSLNYYLGFEDDNGLGLGVKYQNGASTTELAFLKNAVYGTTDHRDFSGTVASGTVGDITYDNEETNTISGRQSYTISNGELTTILGVSVEYGQLYNGQFNENGDTFNYAAHMDMNYDGWGLQAQYLAFDFDQYDDGAIDPNKIGMGLLDGFFEVASKGNIFTANLSKSIPTSWGNYTIYNDFSMVQPDFAEFDDSILNTTGVSVGYGNFFVYVDLYNAKNVLWLGGNSLGLAQGNDDWDHRFNINFSYNL